MIFSPEQQKKIEELSGINYSLRKIAMYLDIKPSVIESEYRNPESEFRYRYDRGQLIKEAERDMSLSEASKNGSITAIQHLDTKLEKRKMDEFKDRLLNGHL
jgi:IS30 family transposase